MNVNRILVLKRQYVSDILFLEEFASKDTTTDVNKLDPLQWMKMYESVQMCCFDRRGIWLKGTISKGNILA